MFAAVRINKAALAAVITAIVILCAGAARELKASGEEESGIALPIVMYHSVLKDQSRAGEYIVTLSELEEDIKYILSQGYTPVFCSEVEDYVNGSGSLPKKPIIISFDDGCYNNFYYVLPLLQKYKVKAVFSIVGQWCMAAGEGAEPNPAYSYASIENLKTMYSSGYCEIADHSWDMHALDGRRGVSQQSGETEEQYRRALYNDVTQAQKLLKQSGMEPKVFTYPYGINGKLTEKIIKELGFDMTLGCEERTNYVAKGDYGCLWNMGRYNRPSGVDREEFFEKMG